MGLSRDTCNEKKFKYQHKKGIIIANWWEANQLPVLQAWPRI